ncbi:MAG: type II toxin-antitoxin system HicA family toxin [Proteobacteria bacterium]|nr:type II toxin-antitoxin system HicA family toxin [Pseudomonadota bacterium]
MNSKQRATLAAVFKDPAPASINWSDIESMVHACGAEISEGKGSRVRVYLNGVRAVFHRPHPRKEANRSTVRSVQRFLGEAGIRPKEG